MPSIGFWKTKPPLGVQLDRSHPLGSQVVALWDFAEVAPDTLFVPFQERLSGRRAAYNTGNNDNAWFTLTPYGAAWRTVTGGQQIDANVPLSWRGHDRVTIHARVYVGDAGNSIFFEADGGPSGSLSFRVNANQIQLVKPGVGAVATDTYTMTAGAYYWVGLSYDGTVGQFFVNGASTSSFSNAQTWLSGFPTATWGPNETLITPNALVELWVWDRALGPTDIAAHAADPYAPFAPPVWRRYLVPSTPPSSSLLPPRPSFSHLIGR